MPNEKKYGVVKGKHIIVYGEGQCPKCRRRYDNSLNPFRIKGQPACPKCKVKQKSCRRPL